MKPFKTGYGGGPLHQTNLHKKIIYLIDKSSMWSLLAILY